MRVKASTAHSTFVVTGDGRGIEGRAGTGLLTAVADRLGLTDALSTAVDDCRSWRDHPPGRVLRDLAGGLADGATTINDIKTLRRRTQVVFGPVASAATAWRTIEAIAADELADIKIFDALADARSRAWTSGAAPEGWEDASTPAVIDIDATLVTAHSEKDQAAGTYKGSFGFHPLVAFLDRDDGHGEALAGVLRPGNAGPNSAADNIDVFEAEQGVERVDGRRTRRARGRTSRSSYRVFRLERLSSRVQSAATRR